MFTITGTNYEDGSKLTHIAIVVGTMLNGEESETRENGAAKLRDAIGSGRVKAGTGALGRAGACRLAGIGGCSARRAGAGNCVSRRGARSTPDTPASNGYTSL